MAAKDIFHEQVKRALIKENWIITHDPLEFEVGDVSVSIDLGAENILAAEKAGQKIAVEIKSFISRSPLTDFHAALGQFLNYRLVLEEEEPERILYLAVPQQTFDTFFQKRLVKKSISVHGLKIIVYDAESEVIVLWQN